ncbi:MAG: hypothetical protein N2316_03095 [Spirochaetes bacterium]|nr:hypothetical protein [Spirochaetota bacterium]
MQREILFDRLDEFIREMKELGITKIAFSEIQEKRPRQINEEILRLEDMVKVFILAYKHSTIFKCILEGMDLNELYRKLESEGFEITRRSRNIT